MVFKELFKSLRNDWECTLDSSFKLWIDSWGKRVAIDLSRIFSDMYLGEKVFTTRVYLVDDDFMREIFNRLGRRGFNSRCIFSSGVREGLNDIMRKFLETPVPRDTLLSMFAEIDNEMSSDFFLNMWSDIEGYIDKCLFPIDLSRDRHILSVYIDRPGDYGFEFEVPTIMISPDRIYSLVDGDIEAAKKIFEIVYIHELGHAYMDVGIRYGVESIHILYEEGLANAITYKNLGHGRNEEMIGYLNLLTSKQPFEYQTYKYFIEKRMPFRLYMYTPLRRRAKTVSDILTEEDAATLIFTLVTGMKNPTLIRYLSRFVKRVSIQVDDIILWTHIWKKIKKLGRAQPLLNILLFLPLYQYMENIL